MAPQILGNPHLSSAYHSGLAADFGLDRARLALASVKARNSYVDMTFLTILVAVNIDK